MKPILFNTDMVRAIMDNRKTVTRRVVKPQPICCGPNITYDLHTDDFFLSKEKNWLRCRVCGHDPEYSREGSDVAHHWIPPSRPGDILYVRQTWAHPSDAEVNNGADPQMYLYKADMFQPAAWDKWHPSIHMPREAARIFLRVTDVRVERLQDSFFKHGSTIFSLLREGVDIGEQCRECIDAYGSPCCIDSESECGVLDEVRSELADLWNRCYAAPRPVKGEDGTIDHYESYPWEDIQETRTYKGKPWYVIGNPWVWVIEFERISKEEAYAHNDF